MPTTREQLIKKGLIRPSPVKSQASKSGVAIFLDESGTFEGDKKALVGGLIVQNPGALGDRLVDLLRRAVRAWTARAGDLPDGEIHGALMRKKNKEAYAAFAHVLLKGLKGLTALRVFMAVDTSRIIYGDRNIAHAAVVSRGLAEHLAKHPPKVSVGVWIAGRSTDRGSISNTESTLRHIVLSRLAEELAALGVEEFPTVEILVRHIAKRPWADPELAPLFVADILCNLYFSGKKYFPDLYCLLEELLAAGCPHVINTKTVTSRGQEVMKELGAGAFLAHLYGPAGPKNPSEDDLKRESDANLVLGDPKRAAPELAALGHAVDRQLRWARNLDATERLSKPLVRYAERITKKGGGELAGQHLYDGLNALIDVYNHRGNVTDARNVAEREARIFPQLGVTWLTKSLEFRNRLAETSVNAYDFDDSAARLDDLIVLLDSLGNVVPLGSSFATRGRILSHRAQVHHYRGEDAAALELYEAAREHYSADLDFQILSHHRTRSLLGVGDYAAASRSLWKLSEKKGGLPKAAKDHFLDDLTALFCRVIVENGVGGRHDSLVHALLEDFDGFVGRANSSYPGAATLASLARIAALVGRTDQSIVATRKALLLTLDTDSKTNHSIGLAAALEGIDNLERGGRLGDEVAGVWLEVVHTVSGRLRHGTIGRHFAPVRQLVRSWKRPESAFTGKHRPADLARLVPFGRVGGWLEL